MRSYVDSCLRNLTGYQGKFHPSMESFWRQVDKFYANCNCPNGVPSNHIPLWWAICCMQQVPVIAPPPEAVAPPAAERAVARSRAEPAGVP